MKKTGKKMVRESTCGYKKLSTTGGWSHAQVSNEI